MEPGTGPGSRGRNWNPRCTRSYDQSQPQPKFRDYDTTGSRRQGRGAPYAGSQPPAEAVRKIQCVCGVPVWGLQLVNCMVRTRNRTTIQFSARTEIRDANNKIRDSINKSNYYNLFIAMAYYAVMSRASSSEAGEGWRSAPNRRIGKGCRASDLDDTPRGIQTRNGRIYHIYIYYVVYVCVKTII